MILSKPFFWTQLLTLTSRKITQILTYVNVACLGVLFTNTNVHRQKKGGGIKSNPEENKDR